MTQTDLQASLKTNLLGLDRQALEQFFAGIDQPRFRAHQVLPWIHQNGVQDFAAMTNLSKALRGRLAELAEIRPPAAASDQTATDGTRKWLLRLPDGLCIETVFIPEADRGTLCVSSQVGCTLDCSFCSTGHQGFSRNLTSAEIIGQLWFANRALRDAGSTVGRPDKRIITNVVFMGMGEPLLNFDNVVAAMRLMLDDLAYGLSRRRVTLSTAGLVPLMDQLRAVCPVSLAVSLHAPDDALRDQLVPLNKKFPIAELLAACRRYVAEEPRRRVTFEYVMLAGINDGVAQALALADLLADVPCKINLIPFNPFPGTRYVRSAQPVIDRFREVLLEAGVVTVTRRTRGDDIDAACGQLVGRVQDRTRRAQPRRIP